MCFISRAAGAYLLASLALFPSAHSKEILVPQTQTKPPGPSKTPQEALAGFTVPEGFAVHLVAAEPDVVNPVAMTWDDRGRIWVCESLEYPREAEGRGLDRIRIHDDSNGDGKTDSVKVFVDGLNIPSGIEIGYGGVFVANAPDLLFFRDTNGDDIADTSEVLVTGFGRTDTHELPNCLTWGPDGWLYGLNGVFNHCDITHKGKRFQFNCALWRYHPVSQDFELFCEGTSNPWGLDYNRNGHWFVSACVIDHLWHLTQTGYYHRQSGAYPENVWKILSIAQDYKHPWHAHCGLSVYDADVYPEDYRGDLFMGNIHQGAINRDNLERNGSTYKGSYVGDFLLGNDAWFMPVVTSLGPDGCFWILDWYDRYHCYQDARRDPEGIDRLRGRLWRVTYDASPMPERFNLQEWSSDKLIETLSHPNRWYRRKAIRILTERRDPAAVETLKALALGEGENNGPVEALWTLIGMRRIDEYFLQAALAHKDPVRRLWGVHAAAEARTVSDAVFERIEQLASDPSPDVRIEVAIASSRLRHPRAFDLLEKVMDFPEKDPLIPHIVWENIYPTLGNRTTQLTKWLLEENVETTPVGDLVSDRILELVLKAANDSIPKVRGSKTKGGSLTSPGETGWGRGTAAFLFKCFHPRLTSPIGAGGPYRGKGGSNQSVFSTILQGSFAKSEGETLAAKCLITLWRAVAEGSVPHLGKDYVPNDLEMKIRDLLRQGRAGKEEAAFLLTTWGDPEAASKAKSILIDSENMAEGRGAAVRALALGADPETIPMVRSILTNADEISKTKEAILINLRPWDGPEVAAMTAEVWPQLSTEAQSAALNLLSSRRPWAETLVASLESGEIPLSAMNENQARQIKQLRDDPLTERLEKVWGRVRLTEKDKRGAIQEVHFLLRQGDSDPRSGMAVFQKRCAQCHTIYGHGKEVGPDITLGGRADLDQILSNVVDPNLVIGAGYLAHTVWTVDGQVYNGILVEDSPHRVSLRLEGGEAAVVPRDEIDEMKKSEFSLMPEGLLEGLDEQEVRDLIGFLLTKEAPAPWSGIANEAVQAAANE